MKLKVNSFATTASLYILALAPLHAQEGQEAFMIPRSDRVIKGEIMLPDKSGALSKTKFAVRDGTWVTVEDRKAGYYFGFTGIVNDQTSKPNFQVYRLLRTAAGTAAVEIVEPRDLPFKKATGFPLTRGIKISVAGIEEWQFASAPVADPMQYTPFELKELFGNTGTSDELCCLTCDERTVCASSVANSCGSCTGSGRDGGFEAY